ncbi:MAG: hypothetical protein V2A73_05580, partial [Pseudomonadota bacterium]
GTRNQELEQPPRYGSHLNRRPESRIKSIGWPPSIEQSPSTLRDTPEILDSESQGGQCSLDAAGRQRQGFNAMRSLGSTTAIVTTSAARLRRAEGRS